MNFIEALKNITNIQQTENGADGYKSTGHPFTDFLYKVSSLRSEEVDEIKEDAEEILNNEYILRFLMYIRNPRNGIGERRTARILLRELFVNHDWKNKKECLDYTINHLYDYGRADDVICIFYQTKYFSDVCKSLKATLENDLKVMEKNGSITLLAKWMPSVNTSSKDTVEMAKAIIKEFGWSEKQYRITLSKLRKYTNVVERQMSHQEWDKIDYEKVPSLANLRYEKAFMEHDTVRRSEYLKKLANGEAKINSSVNFPSDIVCRYRNDRSHKYNETYEQLWKNLADIEALDNTIVVRDDSGSMCCRVGTSSTEAIDVATALAIYCGEHCNGDYKNKCITFSETPRYLDFSKYTTLKDKMKFLFRHCEIANTDIKAVFTLILNTAKNNKLNQEDLPEQILIISDMEFDAGANFKGNPIEESRKEFEEAGYKLPKLIFWNVNSRTKTIPVKENELGVFLISGFSPMVLDLIKGIDQEKAIREKLDKEYNEVPLLSF